MNIENKIDKYLVEDSMGDKWKHAVLDVFYHPYDVINYSTTGAKGNTFTFENIAEYMAKTKKFPEKVAKPNSKIQMALSELEKEGWIKSTKTSFGTYYTKTLKK